MSKILITEIDRSAVRVPSVLTENERIFKNLKRLLNGKTLYQIDSKIVPIKLSKKKGLLGGYSTKKKIKWVEMNWSYFYNTVWYTKSEIRTLRSKPNLYMFSKKGPTTKSKKNLSIEKGE